MCEITEEAWRRLPISAGVKALHPARASEII